MEGLVSLLNLLNTLSPLAVIGLLATIIFMMVKGKTATDQKVDAIRGNDLHELGEMAETLRRIEVKLSEEFAYIRARLNGGANGRF